MIEPLCSSFITKPSSLLRVHPPPYNTLVIALHFRTWRSLSHYYKASCVPQISLNESHAAFMPTATYPVIQVTDMFFPRSRYSSVLTVS